MDFNYLAVDYVDTTTQDRFVISFLSLSELLSLSFSFHYHYQKERMTRSLPMQYILESTFARISIPRTITIQQDHSSINLPQFAQFAYFVFAFFVFVWQ